MTKPHLRRYLSSALFVAVFAAMTSSSFAQEEAAAAKEGHTLLEMIMQSGPLIMMIWGAILATSIVMVTFIVQGLLQYRKDKYAPPPLIGSLRQTMDAGNYQEAWEICNANKNYLANVLKAALSRIGRGKVAVEDSIVEHGAREATMARTRNSYLSVIGVIAPMIGLLGTVIGMIGAFAVLGSTGISNPQALAARIGEVLFATASGLFIAIPAFIFYYVFRNMVQNCVVHADDVVNELVQDIPYDELAGVRIGEDFSTGASTAFTGGARKVSMALTTACPVCSGAVAPGVNPCPHCGATLDWAA